jgi:hypothetical protein
MQPNEAQMGVTEEAGRVASGVVEAMKSAPLAIALLVVNIGFLGFAAYILGEVAENARERNMTQTELIANLVKDIRDCRQGITKWSSFMVFGTTAVAGP